MELDDDKDDEEEGKGEKQGEQKEQQNIKTSNNKLEEKSPCEYDMHGWFVDQKLLKWLQNVVKLGKYKSLAKFALLD